jgi:nucleoside-diphosphate-sugar epimerase
MRALVTGGGGFLGGAIVRGLLARGVAVRSLSRGRYPALEALGVECAQGDVADAGAVARAAEGCEAVFHVASKIGDWGAYASFYEANVVGTQNVLAACRSAGVRRLIYTSTPSVVHGGGDVEGVDERAPYPAHFEAHYPATKALAEQAVLAANGVALKVVALRPHLIWGPGDTQLMPRLLERARKGRLRLVGGGEKLIDTIYIDNAAQAHLLAMERLGEPAPACAGRAYFITQGEPLSSRAMINHLLEAAGEAPVHKSVSPRVAWLAGAVLEGAWTALRRRDDPPMTRFVAKQLATAHWYDTSAAKRDLGFVPEVSLDEGLKRLRASLVGPPPAGPLPRPMCPHGPPPP